MAKKPWQKPEKKEIDESLKQAVETAVESAPQELKDVRESEVAAPAKPSAATPAELPKPGYNHDKMRHACSKCGCTQLVHSVTKTLNEDKTRVIAKSEQLTCNDCGTKHQKG